MIGIVISIGGQIRVFVGFQKGKPQVRKSYFHIDTLIQLHEACLPTSSPKQHQHSSHTLHWRWKRSCWFSPWQCFKSNWKISHQDMPISLKKSTRCMSAHHNSQGIQVTLLKYHLQHTCQSFSHETQSKWKTLDQSSCRSNVCHMMHSTISMNWLLTCQILYMQYAHILIWYAFAATKSCSMSWIVCFWYSPLHPSCHTTQLFNWVIFMYQHLLSDTLCSKRPQLFQLPSLYMKESCRHAMMSCLAFAASLCPPALKPIVTDEDQAYMNTPKVTLLKYHLQHCDILPVNRMVILPRMLRYSFSIIPHFKEVLWGCHLDVQGLLQQQLLSSAVVQCGILYPLQLRRDHHRGDQTETGDKTEGTPELLHWKITCWRFDWLLQLSSGRKWRRCEERHYL